MNDVREFKCIGYDFCPFVINSCRIIGNSKKRNIASLLWSKCRHLGKAKVAMRKNWEENHKAEESRWVNVTSKQTKLLKNKIKNISCEYCDKKVSNLKALDQHVSAVHDELWSEYIKNKTVQARLESSGLKRCDNCGFFVKNIDDHLLKCNNSLNTYKPVVEDIENFYDEKLELQKTENELKGKIMNLDELYKIRKNYVDVARENNFEEGLQNLLTELYPDNAHFIYELLQNAEDAGATSILFELGKEELLFYHDGSRLFDTADIDSITSIGNSTKKDDVNKIGKFGVGFKAVFAYTTQPQIHSGDISFEIEDLFVPKQIESVEIDEPYTTLISFPFNHPNKSKKKAYQEVKNHLDNLSDGTLMFLQNISSISWVVNNSQYSLERKENKNNHIEIINTHNNTSTHWLRFTKKLPKHKKLFVGVAYKLQKNEKDSSKFNIVPTKGKVSIFFPADKESSNLKFHIHAPFASTVARDSIKDLKENRKLIKNIAEIIFESLTFIKDEDLLNTDFFEVLPIPDDELSNLYLPIQKKIYDTFQKKKLLPTESGGFTNAVSCYRSPIDIKRVLNREDLSILLGENIENIFFVKSPRQLNSRADKFVQSLHIETWSWSELSETIEKLNWDISYKKNVSLEKRKWIESKPNEWIQSLYALLWDAYDRHMMNFDCSALIKIDDHFNYDDKTIFFPSLESINSSEFLFVNLQTYTSGTNKRQHEKAKSFLEHIGVKKITEVEKIKQVLDKYYGDTIFERKKTIVIDSISIEENIEHMNFFINYYKNGNDISFMKDYKFVLCEADNLVYTNPHFIYIDKPFFETHMSLVSEQTKLLALNHRYLEIENNTLFLEFLLSLGAKDQLEIVKTTINGNPEKKRLLKGTYDSRESSKAVNEDYNIIALKKMLAINNPKISLLLWNTMTKVPSKVLKARYRPNAQYDIRLADSKLVHILKKAAWVKTKSNTLVKPHAVSKIFLDKEFQCDNKNGWLDAIEFGKSIEKQKEEYKAKENVVKELGFDSLEELELFKKLKDQYTEDQLKNMITQTTDNIVNDKKSLRDALSSSREKGEMNPFVGSKNNETVLHNEGKHKENIHKENIVNQNDFTHTKVNVKKQVAEEIQTINTFLYEEYEGHCQVCGDTFAINTGKNFFKHKSLNSGKNRDVNRKGNTVCLCPKHWEIFEHQLVAYTFTDELGAINQISLETMNGVFETHDWVGKDDIHTTHDAFYMLNDEDDFTRDEVYFLPVKIFSQTEYLKYTKAHMLEFIEVWNNN